MVKPGLPTTAELYILPPESKPAKRSVFVDKRIPAIKQAFNENNVSFIVRGGLQVLVTLADPNAGLVANDSSPRATEIGALVAPTQSCISFPSCFLKTSLFPFRSPQI
ncbi:unnamed protein product [Oncorhynchus mykiss]|uniref:Uncharacterized protein n=1 Tax=Oncorhynchus mykiss TaxID=8022 RepID=A0A060W967_ONCMY|nr:unnamed protein product [Oncorhynchus mykiss]